MNTRVAVIVVGLLAAASPAPAQQSIFLKLYAQAPAAKTARKPAPPKPHPEAKKPPAKPAPAAKSAKPAPKGKKGDNVTGLLAIYAAMPEADRLTLQSDLAWLTYYAGPPGGDFDGRTIEAVKALQKATATKETGLLDDAQRARLAAAAKGPREGAGWRTIDDPLTGARFGLPEKIVAPSGASNSGSRWASGRGQIVIETFRLHEAALPALFDAEKKTPRERHADWGVLKPDSFVIAGTQGLKNVVVRAQASGGEVRGITILYDQATAGIMEPVAIAMANSFAGFPDPNAPLPAGQSRAVEYGTAIVADARGDLIASARVTAGCDVITVPGFGHAARIAADDARDLALIRLYGARNLVPAPLGGDSDPGGTLTLLGIADPAAQGGGDGPTKTTAHLDGQSLVPPPAPGFAGAAVIGAQGGFAGMVASNAVVVAGDAAAVPQADLVPAAAVRAFLIANGVAASTASGAMDQSVLRVICVRK